MPPKKPAANSADASEPSSSDALPEGKRAEKKADAASLRKRNAHPSTAVMVKQALQALNSRKGASSQAIRSYIKQEYPSADSARLKHLVRKTLTKGIETGTLVRPANATVTTGATGKFKLAPKVKLPKPKTENTDPNVQKAAKDEAKKPKSTGANKKDTEHEHSKSEDSKPPKRPKQNKEAATSKVAPAKRPKAKAEEKAEGEGTSRTTKAKAKTTKEAKTTKASQSKAAKAGSASSKATGKRVKTD